MKNDDLTNNNNGNRMIPLSSAFSSAVVHAISVHFVIALFVISAASYVVSVLSDKYVIQYQSSLMARWSLWGGAASMLVAIIFGLFAYAASGHDDLSHSLLNAHRNVALFAGLIVLILILWSAVLRHNDEDEGKEFIALHLIASVAILYITWTGTVLVYQYGVGVAHLPEPKHHNHRTYQKVTDDMMPTLLH